MWWFMLGSVLVYNTFAFLVKKRVSATEIYATIMFALFASLIVDIYAGFGYQAWGFFEKEKMEFSALWVILGIYPAVTTLIINWYPYHSSWSRRLAYLLIWSLYSTAYEWATVHFGIIWHENWNLFYSFLLYPAIYYMLIVQMRAFRWIGRKFGQVGSPPPLT